MNDCKILPIGKIWRSEANGYVFGIDGLCPTICCGAHSGVAPKILIVEDADDTPTSARLL